jgi:DNA-binding transcriptional regulator YbjK
MTAHRTAQGAARRAGLVAVARRVLVDDGLEAFVLRRIADAAGMRLGNLQYYFPTRDDLLEAVVRAELEHDLAALHVTGGDAAADPQRRLAGAITLLLAGWRDGGGGVYAPVALLALHDDRLATLRRDVYRRFYAELAAVVRAVDPGATAQDAKARAVLVTALVDGAALQLGVLGAAARGRLLADLTPVAVSIARGH